MRKNLFQNNPSFHFFKVRVTSKQHMVVERVFLIWFLLVLVGCLLAFNLKLLLDCVD